MLEGLMTVLLLSAQAAGNAQGTRGTQNLTTTGGDPDQVICRPAEPVLGSRIARRRICRTRAEWQAFEDDRAQLRRDIQNSAKGPNNE